MPKRVSPSLIPRTGWGPWPQAPHKPPPSLRYTQIVNSQGPLRREALNRLSGTTNPRRQRGRWDVRPPTSPKSKTRSLGGQRPTPVNPSHNSPRQTSPLPSSMASSANWEGRSPQGVWCGPLAERCERSAVPQRTCGGSLPPGGGPRWSAWPGSQRDVDCSSRCRPKRRTASAWDAPFHKGRPRQMSTAPGQGRDPPLTLADPGRSGSPGPSASLTRGPPCPRWMFGNEPRGFRRDWPGFLQSPEPPTPTEVTEGRPGWPCRMGGRRLAAGVVTGSTRLMPGWNTDFTILAEAKGQKWKHSSGA